MKGIIKEPVPDREEPVHDRDRYIDRDSDRYISEPVHSDRYIKELVQADDRYIPAPVQSIDQYVDDCADSSDDDRSQYNRASDRSQYNWDNGKSYEDNDTRNEVISEEDEDDEVIVNLTRYRSPPT